MAAHAHDATQTPPTTQPAESTRTPDRPRERSSDSPTRETDRPPSDTSCDASPPRSPGRASVRAPGYWHRAALDGRVDHVGDQLADRPELDRIDQLLLPDR